MRRLLHNLFLKHSQGQIEAAATDENPESQGASGSSPGEHLSDVPCQRSVHSGRSAMPHATIAESRQQSDRVKAPAFSGVM